MRRPTIIDVARAAGVSKATAARVVGGQDNLVREETRARVLKAVADLGYERNAVAGSLRTRQTFMIALCIPDITNPFWPEVARGVQDTIEGGGYATVTVNSDWSTEREANYLRMVRRNRFDGLIINPMDWEALANLDIPVVILGSGEHFPNFDSVGSDTEAAVQQALEHLYSLGHRRIALIAGRSHRRRESARLNSFLLFRHRHQLPVDPSLIVGCEFTDRDGYAAMGQLLRLKDPPTAVFAANDVLAIGALKAAQDMHCHVPGDVSIVGMDDIYAASLTSPSLTTIAKPKYQIGQTAARMLLERMNGQTDHPPQHLKLPCQFVERASTARPG